MMNQGKGEFISACQGFLEGFGIQTLRSYAREIGVVNPTKEKNKAQLIEEIIKILTGEVTPRAPSKCGAPVKNSFVDPQVQAGIEVLRQRFLDGNEGDGYDFKARLNNLQKEKVYLTVEDPNAQELETNGVRNILKGQLETLNNVFMLLPLDCSESGDRIIVSADMVRALDLREGDVITCYARKQNSYLVATEILTVNELVVGSFTRGRFQEDTACYPQKRVAFGNENAKTSLIGKCLQWLVPMGRGDRGLIVSPLKAGKSTILQEIARTAEKVNNSMRLMTLLVDQSPENVGGYRKVTNGENFLYTTYEDEPEKQVFVAEFILKRAKRYAECGIDVLLLVDSFNGLARAFNDTEASAGGKVLTAGLESKTLQYLKRYFGSARCFEKGGSLTILGSVATDTGNPADDLIKAELSAIGNMEIVLSDELAKRRIYPAMDILETEGNNNFALYGEREEKLDGYIRKEFLPKFGYEKLLNIIQNSSTFEEFEKNVYGKNN